MNANTASEDSNLTNDLSSSSLEDAKDFANTWFGAWEKRDLNEIVAPFTDDVEFHSPLVEKITGDPSGVVHDNATLRQYFQAALSAYPKIDKEIYDVLVGAESIAVYYKSVNDLMSCEIFFGEMHGGSFRCQKVLNNYRDQDVAVEDSSSLANAWIRAWNTRHFDSFRKYLAVDVSLTSPFLKDSSKLATLAGKDEVVGYFESVLERRNEMRFEMVDSLVGKDSMAVLYDVDGKSRE
ncbi:MAG: hypothetical protein SGILL_009702, partial [Bacillariaceae sp.]